MSAMEAENDPIYALLTAPSSPRLSLGDALAAVDEFGFDGDLLTLEMPTFDENLDFLASVELDMPPIEEALPNVPTYKPLAPRLFDELPMITQPHDSRVERPVTGEKAESNAKSKRPSKREELVYLRSTVTDLQEQLDQLQQLQQERDVPSSDDVLIRSVWEDVASRQSEQRRNAEAENAKLRSMLEEQIRVARGLERVLRKRNNVELVPTLPSPSSPSSKRSRVLHGKSPLDQDNVIEELFDSINAMYAQVNNVMSDKRFHTNVQKPFRDIGLRSNVGTGSSVEIVESRVLPFNYLATAKALWELSLRFEQRSICRKVDTIDIHTATDEMMSKTINGILMFAHEVGEFRAKMTQRRFDELDRVVMVFHMLNEPKQVSDKMMRGILMRHRGWTVLERGPNDTTRLKTYHAATPEIYEATPGSHTMIGDLTRFLMLAVETHMEVDLRELESMLLHSTSKSPHIS
ncbi:hypothetical protein Poli38472_004883 [Pythium oligandrum]|uniref:Uncharacterized protein n=1 Tax=Pythium oligandrum TaxID=41045 RepID=A0A8K1CAL9_PYTOL|nr:hypothetical protein Poli38472_004883 [Pythium oligandrum]|eukprot:TMW59814.1 hypothetical protein Poli38472_004883 [Pythium oligandrum]